MTRYRIESRPMNPSIGGWWWHVGASNDPLGLGGFESWADAMRYVDEAVRADADQVIGVCPFYGSDIVSCQHSVCDCGMDRHEGPVDLVQPCGHRALVPGCGGCDPGAVAFSIADFGAYFRGLEAS